MNKCGGVAQLGEHLPCKQGVKSSNLSVSIGYASVSMRAWTVSRARKTSVPKGTRVRTLKTAYKISREKTIEAGALRRRPAVGTVGESGRKAKARSESKNGAAA